jgi:hypothetical protein
MVSAKGCVCKKIAEESEMESRDTKTVKTPIDWQEERATQTRIMKETKETESLGTN